MVDLATFDSESNTRRGLLIDLDVAKDIRENTTMPNGNLQDDPGTPSHTGIMPRNAQRHRRPEITVRFLFIFIYITVKIVFVHSDN